MSANKGWIGVDLDGTLAEWTEWKGVEHIGDPIPRMLARVKGWMRMGIPVKIFTARVCDGDPRGCRQHIEAWCVKHGIGGLEVTNVKDFNMVELWDDRAVAVEHNTGCVLGGRSNFQ